MKTISEIELQIKAFVAAGNNSSDEKNTNKIRKQISFCRKCIMYLEYNPRQDFVAQMKYDVSNQIEMLNKKYSGWALTMGIKLYKIKLPRKYYYKEVAAGEDKRLKTLNSQLRMLNYLLS